MEIKRGEILALTTGEYSDYQLFTLVEAIQDFDINELKEKYLEENPNQCDPHWFTDAQFVKWIIINAKVVKELDYREWYLGSHRSPEMALKPGYYRQWGITIH